MNVKFERFVWNQFEATRWLSGLFVIYTAVFVEDQSSGSWYCKFEKCIKLWGFNNCALEWRHGTGKLHHF